MSNAVLVEDFEVIPETTRLGLPKEILIDLFDRAAGERARVTLSDPYSTGGNEMRRWLTRYLRDDRRLKELGWKSCAHGQLEGIRHDGLQRKLVVLNTDANAGVPLKSPVSVSDKGPSAVKAIKRNEDRRQERLFADPEPVADPIADYDFLYFCVHASDNSLSAELSRPSELKNGHVAKYSKRIILSQPGEKPGLKRAGPVSEDFAEVQKPSILRQG